MKRFRAVLPYILGYILLFIGVLGLILPILPGWALIIPGLILIGSESKVGKWVHDRLPKKIRILFEKTREKWYPCNTDTKEK